MSRLIRVDLPTPDEPMRATVVRGARYGSSRSTPSPPLTALIGMTGMPGEAEAISSARVAGGSSARSDLLMTMTGRAPGCVSDREVTLDPAGVEVVAGGSHDEDRIDIRRDDLIAAFASRCAPGKPGLLRENIDDRRCSCLRLVEEYDKVPPTAGKRPSLRRAPEIPAVTDPPSTSTSHTVFCRQTTRPGGKYGPAYFEKALSCSSVQPRSSSVWGGCCRPHREVDWLIETTFPL